jgi:hypothetical protein
LRNFEVVSPGNAGRRRLRIRIGTRRCPWAPWIAIRHRIIGEKLGKVRGVKGSPFRCTVRSRLRKRSGNARKRSQKANEECGDGGSHPDAIVVFEALMLVACGPGESLLEEVDDGLYRNPPGLLMTVRPTVVGMRHVPWVKLMFVRTMDSLSSEPSYLHLCIADGGTTVGNRMQKGDDRASRVSPSLLRSRVFFFRYIIGNDGAGLVCCL